MELLQESIDVIRREQEDTKIIKNNIGDLCAKFEEIMNFLNQGHYKGKTGQIQVSFKRKPNEEKAKVGNIGG